MQKNITLYFSLIALVLSLVISSSLVLDYYYLPRLLTFSLLIFLFFTTVLFRKYKPEISIDIFVSLYGFFLLYSTIIMFFSFRSSHLFIEIIKLSLFFLLFTINLNFIKSFAENYFKLLFKFLIIVFFYSAFIVLSEVFDLRDFTKQSLYKIKAISGHKNLYSSFVFLLSIFTVLGIYYLKKYWRYLSILALVLQFLIVFVLEARTVWLAYLFYLLFVTIFVFFRNKKKVIDNKKAYFYIISIVLVLNVFFLFILPLSVKNYNLNSKSSFNTEQISDLSTVAERSLIWVKTYDLIYDNLFFGVGPGNWSLQISNYSLADIYRVQDLNVIFQRPHNDFLWILSEYGIIGFNIFLFFIISIFVFMYFKIRAKGELEDIIVFSGLLAFFVISFFSFPKERIEHNILLVLLLSISVNSIRTYVNFWSIKLVLKKVYLLFLIGLTATFVYVILLSFKGEYFTKKIFWAKSQNLYKEQVQDCNYAMSYFYQLDPTSIPIEWYKGNALASMKQYKEAKNSFVKALKQNPTSYLVFNDYASALVMEQKTDSAIYFYKESIRINPRFDDPRLNLVAIYINLKQYREAEKWNKSLFHDSPRRTLYREIINEYKELK